MVLYHFRLISLVACFGLFGTKSVFAQPVIVFDYSLDSNNFFTVGSPQRIALETAAARLTGRLTDNLTAITSTPTGVIHFDVTFNNPGTGVQTTINDFSVAQNTLVVYAGAHTLGSNILGQGGPGGYSVGGTTAFVNNAQTRGQAGALLATPTDFGPWGGAITFDNSASTTWNYSLIGPVSGTSDFLSVAEHELGHLLGIGTADSWNTKVVGTTFTGAASTLSKGGVSPSVTAEKRALGIGNDVLQ